MSDYCAYTTVFILGKVKFYTLYMMNDIDKPITFNNKILFSPVKEKMPELLKLSSYSEDIRIEDNGFTMTPSSIIKAMKTKEKERASAVLDYLNATIDFLNAVNEDIDIEEYEKIKKLADFLTFNSQIKDFFNSQKEVQASNIINFINWSTGVIFNKSKIIF